LLIAVTPVIFLSPRIVSKYIYDRRDGGFYVQLDEAAKLGEIHQLNYDGRYISHYVDGVLVHEEQFIHHGGEMILWTP
jgi:hypothetical protein